MSKNNKLLIVLAQSLEQPRIVKRIVEKSFDYDSVVVYGFNRKIHRVNNYDILSKCSNVVVNEVANFSNKEYLNRILSYLKLIFVLYKNHGLQKKHIYVFGIDLRLICLFILNSNTDYEISDIMWLYKSKFQRKILENIDGFLVRNSKIVVFTSLGFYTSYYKKFIPSTKIVIKENKFKTYDKVKPIDFIISDMVRIAYVGAFRYTEIVENLIKTVLGKENVILNFYGDGNSRIVKLIQESSKNNSNIFFHGSFKNPDDLQKIYSENNLNFVVYNNASYNEQVAMPNKFYESGYFNIPIVVAQDTYVEERVLENDMGWSIGISLNDISTFVYNLEINEIIKRHNKIKTLDKSLFQI